MQRQYEQSPADATPYWESIFAQRAWGAYPPEELVRFIARNFRTVPDRAQIRVLEIGCGPGPNIWFLAREGYSVAGIDGSPTAIRQADERLRIEGLPSTTPNVELKVGDFTQLPWPDGSFDAVVDIEALYANPMQKIRTAVAEVGRVLKPGGLFFGKMFADESTGSQSGAVIEPGTVSNPTSGPCAGNEVAHFFSREELPELFSDFSKLAIDQIHRTDGGGEVHIYEWLVQAQR
jgi:SAM-dependent methyltransferase